MKGNRMGREVAESMIRRSDHGKKGFLRFAFDEDWLNPQLYDLILNTEKLSIDSAVKMVVEAAKSKEINACGIDSVKSLKKPSLHRKLEAAFLEKGILYPHLFFTVNEAGSVRFYGVVNSQEEKENIEKVVKKIKDVKRVSIGLKIIQGEI